MRDQKWEMTNWFENRNGEWGTNANIGNEVKYFTKYEKVTKFNCAMKKIKQWGLTTYDRQRTIIDKGMKFLIYMNESNK